MACVLDKSTVRIVEISNSGSFFGDVILTRIRPPPAHPLSAATLHEPFAHCHRERTGDHRAANFPLNAIDELHAADDLIVLVRRFSRHDPRASHWSPVNLST